MKGLTTAAHSKALYPGSTGGENDRASSPVMLLSKGQPAELTRGLKVQEGGPRGSLTAPKPLPLQNKRLHAHGFPGK